VVRVTVYVGIVTYNSAADLPVCFAALNVQTYPDIQITVLDNASSDGSAAWAAANAPHARLIESALNVGYGRGHNRILSTLTLHPGDFYLTLNPDVQLAPNYISALVNALADDPRIGWATGKLIQPDTDPPLLYSAGHALFRSGFAFNIGYGLPDTAAFDVPRRVFGAPGAAALYSADLIAGISCGADFFDPALFLYAEDTDVDWRANLAGWQCGYIPAATALHRGSTPTGRLKSMAIANRYLSVIKNAALFDLLTYNLPYMLAHGLARLIVSPAFGWTLTRELVRHLPDVLRRRTPNINRDINQAWFHWSAQQPSTQRSAAQRITDRLARSRLGQRDRGDGQP